MPNAPPTEGTVRLKARGHTLKKTKLLLTVINEDGSVKPHNKRVTAKQSWSTLETQETRKFYADLGNRLNKNRRSVEIEISVELKTRDGGLLNHEKRRFILDNVDERAYVNIYGDGSVWEVGKIELS